MTKQELIDKLNKLADKWDPDPDTFMGSAYEFHYAIGKSEAFSEASTLVSSLETVSE